MGYFSEAWNVLDVVSLLLVYVTTTMRFFLLSPGLHLAYHLLSGARCLPSCPLSRLVLAHSAATYH